jgi:hypothetical protein
MLDRPDASELLEAIAAFLTEEVVPAFEGRKRFHALVAANVAQVLARELRLGPGHLEAEVSSLWDLLGRAGQPPAGGDRAALARELAEDLCARIGAGEADGGAWRSRVLAYLKDSIGRRLEIDNPKLRR